MSKNTKQFEFKLGRTGLIFFISAMSISIFAFFLLGVKVGANLDAYPEKLAAWPASVVASLGLGAKSTPAIKEHPVESAEGGTGQPVINQEDRPAAENPAALSRAAEEAGKAEKGQDVKMAPDLKEQPVAEDVRKAPLEAMKPAKAPTVPARVEPLPPPTPPRVPAAAAEPKAGSSGNYLIQVASFREREKADKFCVEIVRLGYKPEVEQASQNEAGLWFRVVIRNFSTIEDARKASHKLDENIRGVKSVVRASDKPEN
ncbi:MAG: SPOR domain-containing protein [Smithellaceae bacterium]|nr:SPOR domain-containing protein [Smithellaceae bacterium]